MEEDLSIYIYTHTHTHKFWSEKTEGKRALVRSRCRWEDSIRMDLREICSEGVDWGRLLQDRDLWWVLG
jgi:hypothetical protein